MTAQLTFLGGVGTVTGSKYLLTFGGQRVLVDCGLFQGFKKLRQKNWAPLPIEPSEIDAVVLTHAHLDHSGYLPLLVRNGFKGPVYATSATTELCGILLPDSGHLQERDAEFANRHGFSKHRPAAPLYTERDARNCLGHFRACPYEVDTEVIDALQIRFLLAGHILGSAFVRVSFGGRSLLFSGDIGRPNSATMVDPTIVRGADYLIMESTYGNRLHDRVNVEDALAETISRVAARGGTVLIPAFAVGRAQSILFHLQRLKASKRIPDLPVFLDSPMAVSASEVFCRHMKEHRLTAEECQAACNVATYVREAEESKALDENPMPKIIISASGMATGGRILHHLKFYVPDERHAVLFTGFQAGGTRGASLVAGVKSMKIHGRHIPIRAEIANLSMLSAHADADEILTWLGNFTQPPKRTYITHGEPDASEALRVRISDELQWPCVVPEYGDQATLD